MAEIITKEILVEVKLDLKDAKTESYLKNWVNWMKCYVRIDAIECFPCYLKVSFYHENDANREFPFSVIRLNIPGVRVGSAASRTKSHTYGIFWKSNRKRCRLFMAFPDKQSTVSHMDWLKRSIDSLEQYRKEILEKHRSSRTILPGVLVDCSPSDDNNSFLNSTKGSLNDTQNERDMKDILGPLPDIPASATGDCSRWSVRRSSGCSGIYEEIMDQPVDSPKPERDGPRGSIVSAIYVDMSSPVNCDSPANPEMPPPLPPRRRMYSPTAYTPVSSRSDANTNKNRRSTWIKNVFGRTKTAGTDLNTNKKSSNEFTKSRTTGGISKLCSDEYNSNLLANCKNSFSTPDLTNITTDTESIKVPHSSTKGETTTTTTDETDLDVMDIERSNSLNCSSNQFLCRPPPLNISANILWSHNLSTTMSSSIDSSAINLVGANVNNVDSFLGHDMSGYCKMAPIIKPNKTSSPIEFKSPENLADEHKQLMNSSSIYCPMAPILRSTPTPTPPPPPAPTKCDDEKIVELTKNITFERHFEFDEECHLECSMKSNGTNAVAQNDETSSSASSGVSSDDGISTTKSTSICCDTSLLNLQLNTDQPDDAISLTYTESPPQSARSIYDQYTEQQQQQQQQQNPFTFRSTKFDEKLPSYFPNEHNNTVDTIKYTVKSINNNNNNQTPHSKLKSTIHMNSGKKLINKTVMKSPAEGKVLKMKQRRNSMSETNNLIGHTSNSYPKENWCIDTKRIENRKYKTMPKQKALESKKVLLNLDPNMQRAATNFEKNAKITKTASSPRRIYNKCATMAIRIKTPSTETMSSANDSFNSSIDSNLRVPNSDISNGGLIRSWTRFRRIDFSPLKTKINSILQRTNSEF